MVQNSHDSADHNQEVPTVNLGPINKERTVGQTPSRQQVPRVNGRPRVLIAEDDNGMRTLLAKVLRADGYTPVECHDGIELFGHLEAFVGRRVALDFDVIISDILMPGPTGLEILEALHDRTGFPPMILITAFGDKGTHARAKKAGAAAVLDKPFEMDELLAKLHEIAPP